MSEQIHTAMQLLTIAKELYSKIAGEKKVSMRLDCASNLATYTVTITADNVFSKWVLGLGTNEIKFPVATTYNVRAFEVKPVYGEIKTAVRRTADEFIVNFRECLKSDVVRLQIQYFMQEGYAAGLVYGRSSPEPFADEMRYKLSAQLIDPESLVSGFNEMEIEEFPVTARVSVKDSLDVKIPGLSTFKELRRLEEEMFANYKPGEGFKIAGMQRQRYELSRQLQEENPRELLGALNRLLLPAHFRGYLKLEDLDFKYFGSSWGEGREMPGNVILPEEILVVTRTDLSLDKKAAHDILHYDVRKFENEVEEAVDRHSPKKEAPQKKE